MNNFTTIINLIREAETRLNQSDAESALWRLVDAAGLVAREHPHTTGTQGNETGRGFYVANSKEVS